MSRRNMTLMLRTSWPNPGYSDTCSQTVATRLKTYGPIGFHDRDRIVDELRVELTGLLRSDRLEGLVDIMLEKCSHEFKEKEIDND